MSRRLFIAVILATCVAIAWLFWRGSHPDSIAQSRISGPPPSTIPLKVRPESVPAERSTLADTLNAPSTDIRTDLRLVTVILDTYRSNFPRQGNPVGNNAEITAVLAGRNALQLSLIPRDLPAINARGELCDRWGTPFFFHAESANQMEVRSAGPDKTMWSDDDVVLTP